MAVAGIDESALRRAFLDEAEDLHAALGRALLALEQDTSAGEHLHGSFRAVHSIKSESAMMGQERLSRLAHGMEDVLGKARDSALALDRAAMDLLFAGSDLIGELLGVAARGGSDAGVDTDSVLAGLAMLAGGTALPARIPVVPEPHSPAGPPPRDNGQVPSFDEFDRQQIAEARDRGESLYRLVIAVDESEPMKFARAYLVAHSLEASANLLRTVPPLEGEPVDDALYAATCLYLTTRDAPAAVLAAARVDQVAVSSLDVLDFAQALGEPGIEDAASPATPAGAPPVPGGGTAPGAGTASVSGEAAGTAPLELPLARPGTEKPTIRVDTRKLDDLWSMVAELVTRKSRVARLTEKMGRGADLEEMREELADTSDSLEKIAGGMQRAMMDTRMIPISVIFSKFPRLVRDLSRKLGKNIELTLAGEDTEIDRGLVEALSDPLTHIIRNSIDHGIESPAEREQAAKPARGRVAVSARQQGGTIVVEVSDDGRGIDLAGVRRKAVSEGITGAATMGEDALLDVVFRPGFSTREVVTDLSGRGVGLDVVATRIRSELKGDVLLATEKGRGTRVTLLLPLTLTIVNALLVRSEGQVYAIPLAEVDGTVKVLNTEVRGEGERETWVARDGEMPLFRLGALLGRGGRRAEEQFAVVLHHGGQKGCLVVDELIEEQQIVIKPVDDLLNTRRLFSGVSLLEDGTLVFILDTSFTRGREF
jgi:two-component system chemotaxis sensor kinase CheA